MRYLRTSRSSNLEFEYVNQNSQLTLVSLCFDNCSSFVNITWNVYQRSTNVVQWTSFNQTLSYENRYLFGKYSFMIN